MDDQLNKLKEEIKQELAKQTPKPEPKPEPKGLSKRDRAKKHRIIKGGF